MSIGKAFPVKKTNSVKIEELSLLLNKNKKNK